MTTRIGITGAAGRMGRTLIEAIGLAGTSCTAGGCRTPESSLLGADSGELAGQGSNGVPVVGSLAEVIDDIDVLIDFTVPAATLANVALCAEHGVAMVIGTTGFTPEQQAEIERPRPDCGLQGVQLQHRRQPVLSSCWIWRPGCWATMWTSRSTRRITGTRSMRLRALP